MSDFIVIGAGSGGSVAAARLSEAGYTVTVVEAGPTERVPTVKVPFGLVWNMGNKARDWCMQTTPQKGLNGRSIGVPRGKMVGGSGSINSMVWFRGQALDFDGWNVNGWAWDDVVPAFEAVEERLKPVPIANPHPIILQLYKLFGGNTENTVTPEKTGYGRFQFNMRPGRRNSAADAFLRPAMKTGRITLKTGHVVDRIDVQSDQAKAVILADGTRLEATKGVVMAAGSIGSPAILMRSGIGPADDLTALDIPVVIDAQDLGQNLHDHPGAGLHFAGPRSGWGLSWDQAFHWAIAPFAVVFGKGRFASPTVEGGGFFNAREMEDAPDVQTHFIPFKLGNPAAPGRVGSGYFADVCVCRPKSRGSLTLASKDPNVSPNIDLGLFNDPADLDTLVAGLERLQTEMAATDLGPHQAPQVHPPQGADLRQYVIDNAGTAYHPVGTLALDGPVDPQLKVKGTSNIWVADASVMPQVTSANTNAPSMMIGYRAADFIVQDQA